MIIFTPKPSRLLVFCCLIFSLAALPYSALIAQNTTITGTVTAADGGTLPGATVQIKGTTVGTITDINGRYTIEAAPEDVLVVSFVGYTTKEIMVGSKTTVDFIMEPDIMAIEEIVVIGYGTVQKSDLTGAVSSIKSEDLVKVQSNNVLQSLQGKVAGVQVSSASGEPGQSPIVRIRGQGTFNNANPIYVVDGVILDDISYLNSSDIASMEVLKDASATAIYGSRGANGVFIITTKQGTKGEGVTVNVHTEMGIQRLQKRIDLLSGREFAIVVNEFNTGAFNNIDAVPNTDWQDLIFETDFSDVLIQNYNISISGGTAKSQYYTSIGYFGQDGIIPGSDYNRLTLRFNNSFDASNWAKVGSNLTFVPGKSYPTIGNAPFNVYRAQPTIAPFDNNGNYNEVPGVGNVLADLEYNANGFNRDYKTVGNIYTELSFLDAIKFRTSFGADITNAESKRFSPVFFVSAQQQNTSSDLTIENNTQFQWLWENTLSYFKKINKHQIDAIVGYTFQENANEKRRATVENLIRDSEDFWYIDAGDSNTETVQNNVDPGLNFSMRSILARFNYVYNSKYLFTATFRRDGSSKFIGDNRFGNFPSFALGWNAINEDFLADNNLLSNLKFRASWGKLGNEKIDYTRIYSRVVNNRNGVFGQTPEQYFGQTFGDSGNPNLRWETSTQLDIGVELGWLDDKLTAEVDYFHKTTEDILVGLDVPGYLGNGSSQITFNAAEVLNSGFELTVNWRDELPMGLTYSISFNGTTLNNETKKVSGTGGSDEVLYRLFNGTPVTQTIPGDPIGSFYGYLVDGIFQNQSELDSYPHRSDAGIGDLRFVDVNNDGAITGEDRTNLGSPIPTYLYGGNIQLGYKGFALSMDFQGQGGNKIYNLKETIRPDLYNYEQHVFNYWNGEGTSTTEPRPSAGGYNFLPSSRFIQDGGFFRLRNISLGYQLPQNISDMLRMKSARVFVSGTNVITRSEFTGYSPEVSANDPVTGAKGDPLFNNVDLGTYPVTSIYSLGIDIKF